MNRIRIWSMGVVALVTTLLASHTTAHAQARMMVVVIDASGSMNLPRKNDLLLPTRFAAAKARAREQILIQAGSGLDGVAVYTFSGTTATRQTAGFIDPNEARTKISTLDLFTVGGGSTPLAGSVCDAVDALVEVTPDPADVRILQLASDGEENSTLKDTRCWGLTSSLSTPPYTNGSWQYLMLNYVVDRHVAPYIDLFSFDPIIGPLAARASDPEAIATARANATGAAGLLDGPPTLAAFFAELAREGGGRLTVISDQQAQLPVFADFTGNHCTDRSDAILVARAFGKTGAPQDNPFDLDADGRVGFSDYVLAITNFTAGGCGLAEPYAPRAPIVCSGSQPVTLDGQLIEGDGITIDARVSCRLVIKDSLIVSGQSAIKIQGTASVTVDNSILVGEGAVLTTSGSTVLSTANSVFHGKRATTGAFIVVDRGGNTFE